MAGNNLLSDGHAVADNTSSLMQPSLLFRGKALAHEMKFEVAEGRSENRNKI